jgi:hypothetical protein
VLRLGDVLIKIIPGKQMVWFAKIETDTGDKIRIEAKNGIKPGNSMTDFYPASELYCSGSSLEDALKWFTQLDDYLNGKFCEQTQAYRKSLYFLQLSYTIDNYELYCRETGNPLQITERGFKEAIYRQEDAWQDIRAVLGGVQALLGAFKGLQLRETSWYSDHVKDGFDFVEQTLVSLLEEGVEKVRIYIE